MTTLQVVAVLMTPAAGLIIAAAMMYIVRRDTAARDHHPAE